LRIDQIRAFILGVGRIRYQNPYFGNAVTNFGNAVTKLGF